MYDCPRCERNFESYISLAKHTSRKHKLKGESLYCEFNNITKKPLCGCGCNQQTNWRSNRGYAKFVNGHNSFGKNNPMYGKSHTEEAKKSISKKRKEKFESGEYDEWFTERFKEELRIKGKEAWEDPIQYKKNMKARKNSGWREKLSKAQFGKNNYWYGKKRPKHSKLMKSPEMIKKLFRKRSMTDIEKIVAGILDDLNIKYHHQFFLTSEEGNTYSYDFKLKGKKLLLK